MKTKKMAISGALLTSPTSLTQRMRQISKLVIYGRKEEAGERSIYPPLLVIAMTFIFVFRPGRNAGLF
jgi:hypothetical protein